ARHNRARNQCQPGPVSSCGSTSAAAVPRATGAIASGRVRTRAPATQSPNFAFSIFGALGGLPPGRPLFVFFGVAGFWAFGTVFGSMRSCLGLATQRVY